ncbi:MULTISPECIES: acetylxylan esterase [Streptosporangium]|uniref:Cephalosporin-C deacetylase n=1 Tax=Streptosporangium brasiliense TaxID=47480 RepID=A0ABT9QXP6_9ACTN|nr:acetylxylan esterase [Streptosporangium brasiliense]MDP9861735.1 cephalosporin-C deacetylase [Streptosporangium brasiliense]
MFVDMPLEQLRNYRPELREPAGFDAFWERTLAETRLHDLAPVFTEVETDLALVRCFDVRYAGFGGHEIRGWLLVPAAAEGPLPCVVQYIGYNGGRGMPHDWLTWPVAGWAVLVMDSRGQGGGWRAGETADPVGGTWGQVHGKLTQGVLDPDDYYYRRLYADGVRAVEAARAHPLVDPSRVVVSGSSQGGALAMAVSALVPDLLFAFIDVPFMSHIRRAAEITDEEPYAEIGRFLKNHRHRLDQVFATLDHFDGMNFAARNTTPALFSVGLRDGVTPASTVFAAYNHHAGPKDIRVWHFNAHEGGESAQVAEHLKAARDLLAGLSPVTGAAPRTETAAEPSGALTP